MGLDMYLYRKTYVKNWDHYPPGERWEVSVKRGGKPFRGVDAGKVCGVTEEVGYWRKANAVHKWFVDHVQGGRDDCGEYYCDPEKLKELRDLCARVASLLPDSPEEAAKLLPTQSGFFFGSTDYGHYYLQDAKDTVAILDAVLADAEGDENRGEIYYHSSW